jgi:hypothetical protein
MPMHSLDLGEDWTLVDDGCDVVLLGPGRLEIVLTGFDPRQLTHEEGLGPACLGTLRQISWRYPLGSACPWVEPRASSGAPSRDELQLITTWDTAQADGFRHHRLHVGPAISWTLPDGVGTALGDWLARQEEHRGEVLGSRE